MEKKLKVILAALIVILLTLISFVGIYTKESNVYKNIMAKYLFGKNLEGSRIVELAVDTSTKEVIYDKDGNIVENTDKEDTTENSENVDDTEKTENTDESEYTTVEEPINLTEILTEENYKLSKKIIEKRLDNVNVEDYTVKLNTSNGKIIVEIPENSETDNVVSYLDSIGSFEIVDKESKDILLDNEYIRKAQVAYNTDSNGTIVYLIISFNKEGTKKLEDISSEYTLITDGEDNTTEKSVILRMEGEDILTTYFKDPITNGEMQLTVGDYSTSTTQIQQYLKNAAEVSMLLNSGKMPITYVIESEEFIKPVVNDFVLSIAIYVLIGLAIVSFIYLVLKYKKYGALTVIGSIAAIDLLLLVIRYTNVYLSIESAIAFIVLILFNIYILKNTLKDINKDSSEENINKEMKNGLLKSIDMIVALLIISVVFTFMNWSAIVNVGILIFWGLISIGVSHLIFTRTLLLNSNK